MIVHPISIAIVILHYGKVSLTQRLHMQLMHNDPACAEHLFVLDNCAPEPYPHAWLRTDENLYWAGALEYALRDRQQAGYSHVWFLNNDILFSGTPPYLARVTGRLKRLNTQSMATGGKGVGVYAPAVNANPYHPQMVCAPAMQYRTVTYVDGIAPLVDLTCWQELGGIDMADNPYGYGVDVWFSHCAAQAGWQVVVDHQVTIKHLYHSTAREVDGFLSKAAAAEQGYLSARMGADYKERMRSMQQYWNDHDRM